MKLAVIGCGNMAKSIVIGLAKFHPEIEFLTYNPTNQKAMDLANLVKGNFVSDLSELSDCDILLVGCKPQQFEELSKNLVSKVDLKNKHIVSIMAAISINKIIQKTSCENVTRLMPSLPIELQKGISLLYHSDSIDLKRRTFLSSLLEDVSLVYECKDEEEFDQITVISACGPAYIYYFASLFQNELIKFGVKENIAKAMVIKLFEGSSDMMGQKNEELLDMLNKVTSKAGVTIEAIKEFEESKLPDIISRAADRAYNRSLEIERSI